MHSEQWRLTMQSHDTPSEEWRAVVGYEGLYEVSDLGRVKNVARGRGRRPGHVMQPAVSGTCEYPRLCLKRLGASRNFTVHTLVAAAFIGPRPDGQETNHRNNVKTDNRAANLEYVTQARHTEHAFRTGQVYRGEQLPQARLAMAHIQQIRALRGVESQATTAARYGIRPGTVGAIQRRDRWEHVVTDGPVLALRVGKLTDEQVREIRALRGVVQQRDIAVWYGISQSVVSSVQTGKSWRNVT
jgi:hypothetical protein